MWPFSSSLSNLGTATDPRALRFPSKCHFLSLTEGIMMEGEGIREGRREQMLLCWYNLCPSDSNHKVGQMGCWSPWQPVAPLEAPGRGPKEHQDCV